ncbi:hypothetical protein [Blastopirellula marina]|uniref:Uncharacterized protein n=1 Tax=Blastopirellula marina TaxID=124 RepID=A0A2S8F6K5_9BACT|nr:hypothetical protein [Blastopirellula marina]PQO27797.1 hypothetical protein C5Y98_27290 [Blastopirellula marina]PTL41537.1 hypothetical protein C5Y97_27305 [Blastopirellula marina]
MLYEQSIWLVSLAGTLLSLGTSVLFAIWLGMMLLSPDTLEGLDEASVRELRAIRRGFVRLLFRGMIWLGVTLALNLLVYGLFTVRDRPETGILVAAAFSFILWFYVVVGSLTHAWNALAILAKQP